MLKIWVYNRTYINFGYVVFKEILSYILIYNVCEYDRTTMRQTNRGIKNENIYNKLVSIQKL